MFDEQYTSRHRMSRNSNRFAEYVKARKSTPPPLLFKYTSLCTARKIIETEMVRFSSPIKFNDPLDAQWNMLWQLSTPAFNRALIERMLADEFDMARMRNDNMRAWVQEERAKYHAMSAPERQQYVTAMAEDLDKDIVMPPRVSDQLNRLRVFCLASVPDSVQMWSYYADGHSGAVLAFDSAQLEHTWKLPVDQVVYADKLPEVLDPDKYPEAYLDAYAYGEQEPEVDHVRASHLWTFTK